LIKGAIDEDSQKFLAQYAMYAGTDEKTGFWRANPTSPDPNYKILNATPGRGRIYQALTKYPDSERITKFCLDLVRLAQTTADKLPDMQATHLLLLYYATADGMGWHRDSDKNDGDNDHPIVSISLGNSSEFGYKPVFQQEQTIVLESGDVLIWGGPQRMLEHCVRNVRLDTCPSYLRPIIKNARLNFTFRSAPNILGKEEMFATDKYWVDPSS